MKTQIISASINYLVENDLETFTIETAAKESGVNKSALLKQFRCKQELLDAIALQIFENFKQRMTSLTTRQCRPLCPIQAFLHTAQEDILKGEQFAIACRIMKKTPKRFKEMYAELMDSLYQDTELDDATITFIKTVVGGLYYARYLDLYPITDKEIKELSNRLLKASRTDEPIDNI